MLALGKNPFPLFFFISIYLIKNNRILSIKE